MPAVSYTSIFYMLAAAFCFTILNSMVRYVNHLPTFQLVFFRCIGSVVCCLFVLKYHKIPFWGKHKKWLMARAVVGFLAMSLFFKSVSLMPIGTAVTLRYLAPFFAAILAVLYLKEKMKPIQWVCLCIAFIGVVILKGFDSRISGIGLITILSSAFLTGLVYVLIRKIGDREHPVVIVFYFLGLSMLLSGLYSCFQWTNPVGYEWLILCCMGLIGYFAQIFMTKALQHEESNQIVPFKYAEVIFTLIAGWILFGESQSMMAIIAIMLIISALLANVMLKKS